MGLVGEANIAFGTSWQTREESAKFPELGPIRAPSGVQPVTASSKEAHLDERAQHLFKTLGALVEVGYDGLAAVELSRDAHRGADAAREALGHLKSALTRP